MYGCGIFFKAPLLMQQEVLGGDQTNRFLNLLNSHKQNKKLNGERTVIYTIACIVKFAYSPKPAPLP